MSQSRSWTEEQQELFALDASGKLILPQVAVLADAGSGKTSVLVERVKVLVQGPAISQQRRFQSGKILCVSFTERSASDLKERLSDFNEVDVHTIHGFCARILREFGSLLGLSPLWRILDEEETIDLFYRCFEKVYRRSPPETLDHSAHQWFDLCRMARAATGPQLTIDEPVSQTFVMAVLEEFEHAKDLRQSFEYADLERLALKLLERPEVLEALLTRYRHLFIDEFQDTSQLQCDLMTKLVHPEGTLFVVGDQKQSIYRFRGADVSVFEHFVAGLPAQRRLSRNFRSDPKIIEAVNQVSMAVIPNYGEMTAGRMEDQSIALSNGFTVAGMQSDTDVEGVLALITDLESKGVPLKEMVLLLPRIRGNEALLTGLQEKGLGVALGGAGGVVSNPSLRSLLNLWVWACEPWQMLRATQVVIDFCDARCKISDEIANLKSPFDGEQQLSCEQLLSKLDHQFLLKQKLGIYFEQFRHFIFAHQSRGMHPWRLARQLSRLLAEGADVGGFSLLPPPDNLRGSLRVMTVHGSKGLEFPVVILADLKGRKPRLSGPFLKHQDQIFVASRDEDGKLLKSESFTAALEKEFEAESLESGRLLYVAMTRAERALFVVDRAPEPECEDVKPKSRRRKDTTSWSAWTQSHFKPIDSTLLLAGSERPSSAVNDESPHRNRFLASLRQEPAKYHRARLGATAYAEILNPPLKEEPCLPVIDATKIVKNDYRSVNARQLGTDVHECLELGQWDRLRNLAEKNHLNLKLFWSWLDTDEGLRVFKPVRDTHVYNEYAFEWKVQHNVITGRIDRLMIWPEQREAWIIDYKVLLAKRPREEIFAEYASQLSVYADAVRALTGFSSVKTYLLDIAGSTGAIWHCSSDFIL